MVDPANPDEPQGAEPAGAAALSVADPGLPGDDAMQVQLLAAALRADMADLEVYERLLANGIAEVLPAGVIEIERERSLSDRARGREGRVASIRIHLGEQTLELARRHGQLTASLTRNVRGVAISHREVGLDEWAGALASGLASFAAANQRAREALGRLLGA
jgi:hypothetical protein